MADAGPHEQLNLLATEGVARSSCVHRWSLGDWALTLLLALLGCYVDRAEPFLRQLGPQEQDPAISYRHTPKDQARVPTAQLYQLAFWLPLAVLALVVIIWPAGKFSAKKDRAMQMNQAVLGLCSSIALALLLVCLVKNQVGRLRPDFLDRCKLQNGVCTGAPAIVMEGRKSFPSGHTTLSYAGLGYLSLYFAARLYQLPSLCGDLWKVVVVLTPWVIALSVGLSRIADYWHHWEDVLVGGLLGQVVAYSMYRLRYPFPTDEQGDLPYTLQNGWSKVISKHCERGGDDITEITHLACHIPNALRQVMEPLQCKIGDE